MEILQVSDYEKMAEDVVTDFVSKNTNLNDGILKIAKERDLNSEQIKRLVEMSNTKTFLKKFAEKNDGDKVVNFDVADAQKILQQFYSEPTPKAIKITKVTITKIPGSDLEIDFPDMMRSIREGLPEKEVEESPEPEEKAASEKIDALESPVLTKKAKYKLVLRMRKIAEELMNRVYESEHDFLEERDKIASEFCKLYGPEYTDFEKDAMHRFGSEDIFVKHALEEIRRCIKWNKPMYAPTEKEMAQKIAGLETEEIKSLRKMAELKKVQVKYAEGLKIVNNKLESLLNEKD